MGRHQVKSLSRGAIEKVTETILDNSVDHLFGSNCEYCKTFNTIENCLYPLHWKKVVNDMPIHAALNLHELTASIVNVGDYEKQMYRMKKLRYFVSWIFEDTKYSGSMTVRDKKDLIEIKRFGEHFHHITIKAVIQPYFLCRMLQNTTQLLSLDFGVIKLQKDVLQAVGKNCCLIKKFTGWLNPRKYSILLLNLLFEDPETQIVKNNCCNTLEYFRNKASSSISEEVKSFRIKKEEKRNATRILLRNVPNLFDGDLNGFELDDVLAILKDDPGLDIKLREVQCSIGAVKRIDEIRKLWRGLRILNLYDGYSYFKYHRCYLTELHTLTTLTDLNLNCSINTLLFKEIFTAKWPTLKKLCISETLEVLNLTVLIDVLENLEFLDVTCETIVWDKQSHFKSLAEIYLQVKSDLEDYNWFQSFSKTVISINVCPSTCLEMNRVQTFISDSYPYLETLKSLLLFDFELVKAVVNNCTNLREFGIFPSSFNTGEIEECDTYFAESNIHCHLICLDC